MSYKPWLILAIPLSVAAALLFADSGVTEKAGASSSETQATPRSVVPDYSVLSSREATSSDESTNTFGAVVGRLVGPNEEPVTSGVVILRGSETRRDYVDDQGAFLFDGVSPGSYLLLVEEESLPPQYRAPFKQEEPVFYSDALPPGYYATEVTVRAGEASRQDLYVHDVSQTLVHGVVAGRDGLPVANALVQVFSNIPGLEAVSEYAQTDLEGYFSFERLPPGCYQHKVYFPEELYVRRGEAARWAQPLPEVFSLSAGGEIFLGVYLGAGDYDVVGKVVNQDGKPFSGVKVIGFYWSGDQQRSPTKPSEGFSQSLTAAVFTDEEGAFSFVGVPKALIRIQVAPDGFQFGAPAWQNQVVAWPEQVAVDLRGAPRVVALDHPIVAQENRPFIVRGRIVVSDGQPPPRFTATATTSEGEEDIRLNGREFVWGCVPPAEPVTIAVSARGDALPFYEETFYPAPKVTEEVEVLFR